MKKTLSYLLVMVLVIAMVISFGSVAQADVSISTTVKLSPTSLSGPGTVAVTVTLKNNGDPITNVKLKYPSPTDSVIDLGNMNTGDTKDHTNNSWNISAEMLDKGMAFGVSWTNTDGSAGSGSTDSFTIKQQEATVKVTGTASAEQSEVEKGTKVKFTFTLKNEGNTKVDNAYFNAPPLNGGSKLGDDFSMEAGSSKTLTWNYEVKEDTEVKPVLTYAIAGKQYTLNLNTVSVKVKASASEAPTPGSGATATLRADTTSISAGETVNFTVDVQNSGSSALSNLTVKDFNGNTVNMSGASLAAGESATGSAAILIEETGNYSFTATATTAEGSPVTLQTNAISITVAEAVVIDPNAMMKMEVAVGANIDETGAIVYKPDQQMLVQVNVTNISTEELSNISVMENTIGAIGTLPSLAAGESYQFEQSFTLTENSGVLVFKAYAQSADGQQIEIETEQTPYRVDTTEVEEEGPSVVLIVIIIAIAAVAAFLVFYLLKIKKGKPGGGGKSQGSRFGNNGRPPQRPQQQRPQPPREQQYREQPREYADPEPRRQMPRETLDPRPEPPRNAPKQNGGGGAKFGDRNKF